MRSEINGYSSVERNYQIGKTNIIKLNRCLKDWCHIKIKNHKGWMNKINLWGVHKNETFNIPFYQIILDQFWKFDIRFSKSLSGQPTTTAEKKTL